ncbi:MAG: type II toxin-antitoxin system Phd/YefM family antitoxin [Candidatus Rokubacteria bacterium]|nr:type II toxin-antitoxin system Phd/YefM family antitoxin [Candidatus Rokubacteria bacterium]MBI3824386.1 type II toxin-antitoxin system Phd/YefM family antitoxin [Candidatus Rokubacteria bacterium]
MKTAKVAELKNGLSGYLAHVKAGGRVMVFDRDRPIAQIVPVPPSDRRSPDTHRLQRLERKGLIRRGKGGMARWLRTHRPVRGATGVLKALLDERKAGW